MARSPVDPLPGAEEKRQRTAADGGLLSGEARTGPRPALTTRRRGRAIRFPERILRRSPHPRPIPRPLRGSGPVGVERSAENAGILRSMVDSGGNPYQSTDIRVVPDEVRARPHPTIQPGRSVAPRRAARVREISFHADSVDATSSAGPAPIGCAVPVVDRQAVKCPDRLPRRPLLLRGSGRTGRR